MTRTLKPTRAKATAAEFQILAERCLTLKAPSREFDAEIARAIGFGHVIQEYHYDKLTWYAWLSDQRTGKWEVLQKYTGSLDAAILLYGAKPERIPAEPRLVVAEAMLQHASRMKD